jgi:transposase
MMVIGVDAHKDTLTIACVCSVTGRVLGVLVVEARAAGFGRALEWARKHAPGDVGLRVWAIEDCRHVSGGLERFLLARGERVARVPPHMVADARREQVRERGKSDPIDAVAAARAAIREGVDSLPVAQLAGAELEIRLIADHRERLVGARTRLINDLRWHCHDLWPDYTIPRSVLIGPRWQAKLARRLARARPSDPVQAARVQVARDELARVRDLTATITQLTKQITKLVKNAAPALLEEPGIGPLTAAKLLGEIAGITRFRSESALARLAGIAPIPVSSGRTDRLRLDRGGNRQLNSAVHRWAITRARIDPDTIRYLDKKRREGKTRREALRSLKRHLIRRLYRILQTPATTSTAATIGPCT